MNLPAPKLEGSATSFTSCHRYPSPQFNKHHQDSFLHAHLSKIGDMNHSSCDAGSFWSFGQPKTPIIGYRTTKAHAPALLRLLQVSTDHEWNQWAFHVHRMKPFIIFLVFLTVQRAKTTIHRERLLQHHYLRLQILICLSCKLKSSKGAKVVAF